jgi:Icc-related predicted phosphoesterase
VAERYAELSASLGSQTVVTLGNVDLRDVWDVVVPEHLRCRDGEALMLEGQKFGFVGGGAVRQPPTGSPWTSFDRTPEVYRERLDQLGPVDILCTHVPPKLDDLRFDVMADRLEMYGPGVVEYLEAHHPRLALFGHIHNPRARELLLGSTRCVNVGFFKRDGVAFEFET